MLTAFFRAFRTPDLRGKLLFTLAIMALYRFGAHLPLPGVDTRTLAACTGASSRSGSGSGSQAFGLLNLFSGGALQQLSIFALGITPYITASIILQLLTVVIPRLEALKKEGQTGQAKITQYTRYLTIGLSVLESTMTLTAARNNPGYLLGQKCDGVAVFYPTVTWEGMAVMVIIMTAATSLLMWLGELVTDRGVGNGMSVLMFTSIAARFPGSLWAIKLNSHTLDGWPVFAAVLALGMLVVAAVVFVEQGQRRIPVQYSKRMVGRRAYGGTSTYIPLKLNQSGVVPVIFASSLLQMPVMLVGLTGGSTTTRGWQGWINRNLTTTIHGYPLTYTLSYLLLILGFAFFYMSITFDTVEIADNMKKYGGFVPGIRSGRPTVEYLHYIATRITWPGALYLAIVAAIPMIALDRLHATASFPFGGTTILIMVGVGLETVKQIESQLQQHNYEGFLR
ncbi:preprotein translocase subunit SecY [Catenulispora pinisilvae]|uniref:preprotein translocase subunit SecY n=1 Tax=Catenulispora pinisilvae TaxID=2705253 RepID=UPI001891529E|nr:preprotein translocase subunit SecY [Catenulispora pinisilvae]